MTPNAATYSAHEITQFLKNIGLSKGVYPRWTNILSLILSIHFFLKISRLKKTYTPP
jgi:hypothetical protein